MTSNRTIQVALFVIGAAVFGYLVSRIGLGQLASDAGNTGFMFVPIVLLYGLMYACSAGAWRGRTGCRDTRWFRRFILWAHRSCCLCSSRIALPPHGLA